MSFFYEKLTHGYSKIVLKNKTGPQLLKDEGFSNNLVT
ncbi:hypothetical protein BMWSH_2060 [Priestia megaterium WSH-002]|uniref:Uncharacterized protein n=1 Tax=Priestia megaterium (strain WSH-002) TaxID=1006007 RepID=A0A8D3WY19_PRIMW|nr:hypothetical protein BMWSH_2060 [Priestia megaterium WSH-002]